MQFDRRSDRYESSSFRRNRSSDPRKALRMFAEEEKSPWNGSCLVPSANTKGLEEPNNYRKMSMNSAED